MKKGYSLYFEIRQTGTLALIIALFLFSLASVSAPEVSASSQEFAGSIGGCSMFPTNNIWNYPIAGLPVAARSAAYITSIGPNGHLHPDFGSGLYQGAPIGFSDVVVSSTQPRVPVSFQYADESDPGPYPIPANAPIEGGASGTGDRHVLVVQRGSCKLYELYNAAPQKNGGWSAGSGAVWKLSSNTLRPATWTSADAAGLPILPGLVSYAEVAEGVINHALRFTVSQTQDSFLWPARHAASASHNAALPPMGLRLRLKASVSLASFSRTDRIILTALKKYGMFVADTGSSWYLSGLADDHWSNDDLHALSSIPGADFEVVDESSLEMSANSGRVRGAPVPTPIPRPTPGATATPSHTATVASMPDQISPNASGGGPGLGVLPWLATGGLLLLGGAGAVFLFQRKRRRAP